jgi:glycosyltransferase involved in cell wall biosynthesis
MRLLHIVGSGRLPRDPDLEGASGVVRAALEIARAQAKRGHEPWVVAVDRDAWETEWQGVQLVRLRLASWARARLGERVLDLRVHLPLIGFTRRHAFDVVHGYLHYYMRFLRARRRMVFFQTDPFHGGFTADRNAMGEADFALIARTSHVQLAASRFVAGQLQRGLAGGGNVHVVYNGVDSEHFDVDRYADQRRRLRGEWGVSDGDVVFVYAGAIVPEKGVLQLARAFAGLHGRTGRVHLALAGGAALWDQSLALPGPLRPYEEEVRATLAPAALKGKAHFLGSLGRTEMAAVYAASDVAVVPSVWQEPFGLVAVEALASSRPVIASSVGGLPEVVDERCGVLVPPGDERALQDAMRALAGDAALRDRLGAAGRVRALRFSWERAAHTLDAIYFDCVPDGNGKGG